VSGAVDTVPGRKAEVAVASQIELVSDGEGVVVSGDRAAVERFIASAGLSSEVAEVSLKRLSSVLRSSGEVATTASEIVERSALYLKLTPESAQRLKDAGGLMKTKTKGISHAMLGETGKKSLKWLQVEDGPGALLSNPAVLSGVGGLMTQFAQQAEAHELKAMLVRMDEKLDDLRRGQRDAVLAKLDGAAAAIEEAMMIHRQDGDPETLWDKVSGESSTIHEVQNNALRELEALADKIEGKKKLRDLKSATKELAFEVALQLSVLARCFELQDEFRVLELDYVLATNPDRLEGHRLGVADARAERREKVLTRTHALMDRMDAAGGTVNANVLLHLSAARSVVDALNATGTVVEDFHVPLGIETDRAALGLPRWREAVRDPQQLKTAGTEVAKGAAVVGGAAATIVAGLAAKNASQKS
jgi:hypothetical protein